MGVAVLALNVVVLAVTRPPTVLTLAPGGGVLEKVGVPKAEDQIRAAVRQYLGKRYQWEPSTVKERLQEAQTFVLPANLKAYQSAVTNVARFSTEKIVSQRVYPDKIEVNLENKVVVITGDRITTIRSLKAAGLLNLELSFASGPRTQTNPWGLYITMEKELQ
jgi:hypothetical protein